MTIALRPIHFFRGTPRWVLTSLAFMALLQPLLAAFLPGIAGWSADHHRAHLQIEIPHAQRGDFGPPQAGVDQQHDQGSVAPLGEALALAGLQQRAEVIERDHRRWSVGNRRLVHLRHRRVGDFVLLDGPAEEGLQALVAVARRAWGVHLQQVGDEGLDVLAADVANGERHALLVEEVTQPVDGVEVDRDGRRGAVAGLEREPKTGSEFGEFGAVTGASGRCLDHGPPPGGVPVK